MRPANAYPVLIQKTAVQVSAKLSLVDGRFLFSFLFLDRVDVICGHSPRIQIILLLSEDRFLGYRPSYFYLRIPSEDVDHPTSIWGYRSSYFHMRIFFFEDTDHPASVWGSLLKLILPQLFSSMVACTALKCVTLVSHHLKSQFSRLQVIGVHSITISTFT